MDSVAELGAEYVIDEPMLGEPGYAREGRCDDNRVEMMTVAGHVRDGTGDPGLDS